VNENQKTGFTEFLLGVIVAVALFLIWKKEHALVNGGSFVPTQPQTFLNPQAGTTAEDVCPSCTSCGSQNIPPVTNPILAAQISPTTGGSFPSVVPATPRAPVNTLRIGVQYVSPPRAAVPTSAVVRTPYTQQTSPIGIVSAGAPQRVGPSLA
jgi:hypothetical protein